MLATFCLICHCHFARHYLFSPYICWYIRYADLFFFFFFHYIFFALPFSMILFLCHAHAIYTILLLRHIITIFRDTMLFILLLCCFSCRLRLIIIFIITDLIMLLLMLFTLIICRHIITLLPSCYTTLFFDATYFSDCRYWLRFIDMLLSFSLRFFIDYYYCCYADYFHAALLFRLLSCWYATPYVAHYHITLITPFRRSMPLLPFRHYD